MFIEFLIKLGIALTVVVLLIFIDFVMWETNYIINFFKGFWRLFADPDQHIAWKVVYGILLLAFIVSLFLWDAGAIADRLREVF